MQPIEILYLMSSLTAVVAMAPQIKQLVVSKSSHDLSLTTWIAWTLTQTVSLMYAGYLNATPYLLVSIAWMAFYVVMLALIVKYRRVLPVLQLQVATQEVTEQPSVSTS